VVGSKDADADHDRFVELGMSGGDMLTFSRPMKLPDGSEVTPSFKLSFAADLRAPDFFGFAVERINVPAADRSADQSSERGCGISEVILSEPNPTDFQYFIQELACNREVDANSFGMSVELDGATVTVFNKAGLEAHLGMSITRASAASWVVRVVYRVPDLGSFRTAFEERGCARSKWPPADRRSGSGPGRLLLLRGNPMSAPNAPSRSVKSASTITCRSP
jgi:hypothetical protein